MRFITKVSLLILLGIVGEQKLTAQYDSDFYNKITREYEEENLVQLENKYHYIFEIEKGELNITLITTEKFIILKNTIGRTFDQIVYSSEFKELVDFEANSYIFNGDKYKKNPIKEYTRRENYDNDVFYDDSKELKFIFPGVSKGSVIELITELKIHDPRLLGSVFFINNLPQRNFELLIEYDNEINIDLIKFNFKEQYDIEEFEKRGKKYLKLNIKEQKAYANEDYEPSIRYYVPHVIPVIRNYRTNGNVIDVLGEENSLYKWYNTLLKDMYTGVDLKPIRILADSITMGCNTEIEKVKELFYWVQKNVKYIAFEYGLGGFIPRKADDILMKRFGDCKDKTSLLHALLKSIEIESFFTWIGTNDLPYSYSEINSPVVDNHMILSYYDESKGYVFLDGTGKYQWYPLPTSFIQGKEALIGLSDSTYKIVKVPMLASSRNAVVDSVRLILLDGSIHGEGIANLTGYEKIEASYRLDDSDKTKKKDYVEAFLSKGSNKFVLDEYNFSSINSFDSLLQIKYNFTLDNYIKTFSDQTFLNLNLDKSWMGIRPRKNRENPLLVDYLRSTESVFTFEIPKGYEVNFMPENSSYANELISFSIAYNVNANEIIYKQNISINENYFDLEKIKKLSEFYDNLNKAYMQTLVLIKKQE